MIRLYLELLGPVTLTLVHPHTNWHKSIISFCPSYSRLDGRLEGRHSSRIHKINANADVRVSEDETLINLRMHFRPSPSQWRTIHHSRIATWFLCKRISSIPSDSMAFVDQPSHVPHLLFNQNERDATWKENLCHDDDQGPTRPT